MRTTALASLAILFMSVIFTGCGSGPASNTNSTNAVADQPATPNVASDQTTNDAPTLTPLFKAYCDAKLKNDEAALRKVFSQGTIKSFEEQMKADRIKTLVKFLEDEKVSESRCEVKNEKITGENAVAKIFIDSYPNGFDIYFERENGEWKMTNKSPTFEAMKQTNTNSSPAR